MSRAAWLVLLLIMLVATAVRVFAIGEQSFWLDEAHTAEYARMDVDDLWSFDDLYDRANPPGYILLVKVWWQISKSDEWLRMLSALAGILTVPVVFAIGRRVSGTRAGLWAAGFLAVAGFHVRYSQEARAYSLVTLMAAIAMWAAIQLVMEPEPDRATIVNPRWRPIRGRGPSGRRALTWSDLAIGVYGVATGLALHLHNTGIGIILAANVGVGLWWLGSRPRPIGFIPRWLWAHLIAFLVFLPWVPGFLAQFGVISDRFWVTDPTPTSVITDLGMIYDAFTLELWEPFGSIVMHALVVAVVAAVAWLGARRLRRGPRLVVLAFIVTQPIFELIFSLKRPVFLSRTLVWMLVGTAVCFGAVMAVRPSRLGRTLAASLLLLQIASTISYHVWYEKTPWNEAAALVATSAEPDDVIMILSGNTEAAFRHYFDTYGLDTTIIRLPWQIPGRESSGSVLTESDLALLLDIARQYDTTWLVLNSVGNIENGTALAPALTADSTSSETFRFRDVRVMEFD
jgi:mannosyltransferase